MKKIESMSQYRRGCETLYYLLASAGDRAVIDKLNKALADYERSVKAEKEQEKKPAGK